MADNVIIGIQANATQAQTEIDKVNRGVKQTGTEAKKSADKTEAATKKSSDGFAKMAAKILAAVYAVKSLVNAFISNQQSTVRLNAVLKATGGAAGITAGKMKELTKSLKDYTGATTAEIQDAQAVLLTFRGIGVDSFDRTQKVAADLAAVLKTDLKTAMLQMGKAVEDPATGMTALRRAGVSFTAEQKEQIKTLQKSNKLQEAQAIILKTVEEQVGGTAKALNESDAGSFQTALNQIQDVLAKVGSLLAPVLNGFSRLINFIAENTVAAAVGIAAITLAIMAMTGGIGAATTALWGMAVAFLATPMGMITAAVAGLVAVFALFGGSAKSVSELTNEVDNTKKAIDKLETTQKKFNKSADDTIKKLGGLKQGSKAYSNEVAKLLKQYPELVNYGISTSSSIDDIRKAQASLNQTMKDKAMLQAGKEFEKLKDNVEDATIQLADAQRAYDKDPTEQNRAALNSAARMYMGLRREIERTGKLSGKTQKQMQDAVTIHSDTAYILWDGNLKKAQNAMNNTSSIIVKTWEEALSQMTDAELNKERETLEIQSRELKAFQKTVEAKLKMQATLTKSLKGMAQLATADATIAANKVKQAQIDAELRRRAAERNRRSAAGSGGKVVKGVTSEYDLDTARFDYIKSQEDKYQQQRMQAERDYNQEVLKINKATNLTKQQRVEALKIAENKRIKEIGDIEKAKDKEVADARKKLLSDIKTGIDTASSVLDTLTDKSKNVEERLYDAGSQLAKQFGPTGQIIGGVMDIGKKLFNILKGNSESWAQKFEKRLKKVLETYQNELSNIDAISSISGTYDVALLKERLNVAQKAFRDLFKDNADQMLKMSQKQVGNYLQSKGNVQIKDAISLMTDIRQARIDLQSATSQEQQMELEHNFKMGRFNDNDRQYYEQKVSLYQDLIDAIKQELTANGENFELQQQLWSVEEQRYAAQKAINDAKREEIGLSTQLNNMNAVQGFAAHMRNRLTGSLVNSALNVPNLTNSTSNTTNYVINGASFNSPSDMVNELNNQKFYQTGRYLF